MSMSRKQLFDLSLQNWGLPSQITMLAEEAAELSVAALHILRKAKEPQALEHLAEEIADVELMLDEIKYYFGPSGIVSLIANFRLEKEHRLEERLKDGKCTKA